MVLLVSKNRPKYRRFEEAHIRTHGEVKHTVCMTGESRNLLPRGERPNADLAETGGQLLCGSVER